MAQKRFAFDFENRSPKSIAYECDGSERLRTSTESGVPFVFANRAGMLALTQLLVKLSMGEYKQGFHIPFGQNNNPSQYSCCSGLVVSQ